jgi:integrase
MPFSNVGRDAVSDLNRSLCGEWIDDRTGETIRPTPHGWRATFRMWATDKGHASYEAAELALAHSITVTKAQKSYIRNSDMLDQRCVLMDRWADHIAGQSDAKVVPIRA